MEALLRHTSNVYAFIYFGLIIGLALIECVVPRRRAGDILGQRWTGNFGVLIVGIVVTRLLFPIASVEWSRVCRTNGWGILNHGAFPDWVGYIATVLLLDLAMYTNHYLNHRLALLWRIHRTHHTDHEYDFSTSVRFHPFEMLSDTAITLAFIAVIGAPPVAVFVAQVLLMSINFLEHANVRIPPGWDRVLRWVVVTPEMHRIHHSQDLGDSRANLGGLFTWWDRLFGTYLEQPAAGQDRIAFGVAEFSDRKHLKLPWMLALPFLPADGDSTHEDPARSVPLVGADAHSTTSLR